MVPSDIGFLADRVRIGKERLVLVGSVPEEVQPGDASIVGAVGGFVAGKAGEPEQDLVRWKEWMG